jgi:hypothetical protein
MQTSEFITEPDLAAQIPGATVLVVLVEMNSSVIGSRCFITLYAVHTVLPSPFTEVLTVVVVVVVVQRLVSKSPAPNTRLVLQWLLLLQAGPVASVPQTHEAALPFTPPTSSHNGRVMHRSFAVAQLAVKTQNVFWAHFGPLDPIASAHRHVLLGPVNSVLPSLPHSVGV